MTSPLTDASPLSPARPMTGRRIRRSVNDSSYGTTHNVLAVVLLAFLALEPLALGGNRPLFWTTSTLVMAIVAALYSVVLIVRRQKFRVAVSAVWPDGILFLIVSLLLLTQLAPLGSVQDFVAASGVIVEARTLSLAPGSTAMMLMQFVGYGLCFWLVLQISANRRRARLLMLGVFGIVAAYAALGLYLLTQLDDTFFGATKLAYFGSATATFVNRNSYCTYLAMGFCMGWALLLEALAPSERRSGPAWFFVATILTVQVLILAAMIATNSRMGLFSGVAGALLVAALGATKIRIGGLSWRVALGFGVMALAGLVWLFGGGLVERLGSIDRSADVRGDLYAQIWQMILARPILGYGGGAFEVAYPLFHAAPVTSDLIWDKAHSTYLALWVELGLVAGSAPLLLVGWQAIRALRQFLRPATNWVVPLAFLGVTTDVALHSTVDFSLEIPANAYLFVALAALAAAGSAGGTRSSELK